MKVMVRSSPIKASKMLSAAIYNYTLTKRKVLL